MLMGAIYTGAIYGGAYAAILLNTPGTPSSIATTFDGFPMARKGDGDLALTLACLSSVIGGMQERSPRGYENMVAEYFRVLSGVPVLP